MQRGEPLTGIEVGTSGIKVLLAGFELFPSLVRRFLVARGIVTPGREGDLLLEQRWFPLESWLLVHDDIDQQLGANVLLTLGTHILENPKFPAWIKDAGTAIQAIDIAYHRSHRKSGVVMYDETTSTMLEGIGHYRARVLPGSSRIEVESTTPYLCEIDLGIVTGLARTFDARSRVTHAGKSCRRKGGSSCVYVVDAS